MKKSKLFYAISVIIGFVAVFMIFIPQIQIGLTVKNGTAYDVNLTWQTFFGGRACFGDGYQLLITRNSVLPFVGYCLVFAGAAFSIFTLTAKTKNGRATAVVFAFLFLVVGTIFIWCTRLNFAYHNEAELTSSKPYSNIVIKYGIGSILGAVLSTLAPVGLVAASIVDKD